MRSRQISVEKIGGPEVLRIRTRELPPPGPGEALVRVVASGVSFGDILLRVGVIPGGPKRPFTPGFDVTGVVEAVGEGVADLRPGQRVTALVRSGGYAEYATVPASRLVPVPDGVDLVEVAASALNYFIAYQMLHRLAEARPGKRIIVHSAAGGVGTAVLQLARLAGVECYGTCSAAKQDIVTKYGGYPIDYRSQDFVPLMRALPGGGVDAALDPIGGTHFWRSYRALRRGGKLIAYGQSQAFQDGRARKPVGVLGFLGGIVLPKLVPDGRSTTFYNAWSLEKSRPHAYREDLTAVLRLLAAGKIEPVLARILPLDEAAEAHRLLENAAVAGKIVLTCAPAS